MGGGREEGGGGRGRAWKRGGVGGKGAGGRSGWEVGGCKFITETMGPMEGVRWKAWV